MQSTQKNIIGRILLPDLKKVPDEKKTANSDEGNSILPNYPYESKSVSEVKSSDPDHIKVVATALTMAMAKAKSEAEAQADHRRSLEEKMKHMARFGPIYGEDTVPNRLAKDSAWEHMIEQSLEQGIVDPTSSYMKSMNKIQRAAAKCYGNIIEEKLARGFEFRKMMARDGCFFLQLALHILGAGELLGHPREDLYFGVRSDYPLSCITDMFFVGNQIPYIVIDAFIKQPFFKKVIDMKPYWERPYEDDWVSLTLYRTLVEPRLTTTKSKKPAGHHPPNLNVLTALRSMLLGSDDDSPAYAEMREFRDLELGHSDCLVRFPRATELYRSGVNLIKKPGIGISNIRFKNRGYSATLYLPAFPIRSYTVDLLTSLVQHELTLSETDREVTSYIRFMRDLAPTYKDFKHLQDRGIIQVHDDESRGTVIHALHELVSRYPSNFTPKFNDIMREIKEYETVPWHRISFTCSIACGIITFFLAVFTVVQTVFTVLSYYDKPTPN